MANVYNNAKELFLNSATLDLDDGGATYKVLLLKSTAPAYNPDNVFVADLVPGTNEISVSGYARQTLTSRSVVQDDTNDLGEARANKVTFASLVAGQTVGAAVIYKEVTTDADSLLVSFYDLTDTATNGGDIEVRWNGVDGVGAFLQLTET